MIVAYDGTDYAGWIQQKGRPSIVSVLQDRFEQVFKRQIRLLGASRTDAGVHALGQVASFAIDLAIDACAMRRAWNNVLPSSIFIRSLVHDDSFHPHRNVALKMYYYHLFEKQSFPFVARYGYQLPYMHDIQQLGDALNLFVGAHNFSAFCTGKDHVGGTVRIIDRITVEYIKRYHCYRITVVGKRFLRHMVRRIVGAALSVASGKGVVHADIRNALAYGTVHPRFKAAPARGLMLGKVRYQE